MENPICSQIDPHCDHDDTIKEIIRLRFKILREPLGLDFDQTELDSEIMNNYYLVIKDSKNLLGTLLLEKCPDPQEFKMRQVAIRSDQQNKGYGKKLVEFSQEFAKSLGIKRIIVHARSTAREFYTKLGYSFKDEIFSQVGIDHYLMWKDL